MAFDGLVIANLVRDYNDCLVGGRITKIYQPEAEELLLVVKREKDTYKLFMSADASLPLTYFVTKTKENPATAPNFCMLLRKHINGGRIEKVMQPGFERIIDIEISHLDELGDRCIKHLIIEIMGKHSNIIFTDDAGKILDAIKHVSLLVSSVREVLPGREYSYPPSQNKMNPLLTDLDMWVKTRVNNPTTVVKWIYGTLTGISPLTSHEICYRAGIDGDRPVDALDNEALDRLTEAMTSVLEDIKSGSFSPVIVYENGAPKEYSAISLTSYPEEDVKPQDSISELLERYYQEKNEITIIRQKSGELRHIVATAVERTAKKLDIQTKQLKSTENRDKYRIYGEMLNTYGYGVKPGDKELKCVNYYDNQEITVPLDTTMTASENAQKYFARYNKLKRTYEASIELVKETKADLDYLKSVQVSLDMARLEKDLIEIKEELRESGYLKKVSRGKKEKSVKSQPLHYISKDGFHMYVGKNNIQNDYLTFKFANAGDYWFHANDIPGSHVIVKKGQAEDISDETFEEAARLAAYYSSGRTDSKVEIDYTVRANIKKPNGAKPGYVIYHTNYSIIAIPDITGIEEA